MPFEPEQPIEEGGEGGIYEEIAPNTFEATNESAPDGDWQIADPDEYRSLDPVSMTQRAPLTTTAKGNGRATVRTNVSLRFNVSNFIIGRVSGTIAPGSTITGADSNNNGIPDHVEKAFKAKMLTVEK